MIPVNHAHVRVAGRSHPGLRRPNNEDRFVILPQRISHRDSTPSLLAVVADGIGGHQAGEVAAEIAIKTITEVVSASQAENPPEILAQAFIQANERINRAAAARSGQHGMGTTCVAAWVLGRRLYAASLGDSRLYLLRNGQLRQLTTDHTWVQEAVEAGVLTSEQARRHPNARIVRRYLGSPKTERPDLRIRLLAGESDTQAEARQGMRLHAGDRLLLCTDGLSDLVEDADIARILQQSASLERVLDDLIQRANDQGGRDNITAVALEVPRPRTLALGRARRDVLLMLGLIAALCMSLSLFSLLLAYAARLLLR